VAESYIADALTIRALLKENPLEVPPYQRGFAWKTAQVKEFWDDLTEFAEGRPNVKDRSSWAP
jgi:uncharacterized protein with ParB-like and HNH nuclease domain